MSHTISEKQAATLAKLIQQHNEAQAALAQYFSAVADGLGLPDGTRLLKIEGNTIEVAPA